MSDHDHSERRSNSFWAFVLSAGVPLVLWWSLVRRAALEGGDLGESTGLGGPDTFVIVVALVNGLVQAALLDALTRRDRDGFYLVFFFVGLGVVGLLSWYIAPSIR